MPHLAENHYGKSRVRLVKVTRDSDTHHLHEWTVGVSLEGHFDTCFTQGDNSATLPTDTMKNTVYSRARASQASTMEAFALELASFFAKRNPQATLVRITVEEKMWVRITANGRKHPSAFLQRGPNVDTCTVALAQTDKQSATPTIRSGVRGLVLLKTSDSAFKDFLRDSLTTLPDTEDRLLGTEATIEWLYAATATKLGQPDQPDFKALRARTLDTLLTAFAEHHSLSVQHTLYAMAEAALAAVPTLAEITLTLPNRHCLLVDLSRFNQDNPNQIFVPTDEPHGLIHARITRDRA